MLQGDCLLAFAIGASLATSAGDGLKVSQYRTQNKYFVYMLLHLSLIVRSLNIYMLWEYTAFDSLFYYDASINGLWPALNCFGSILGGIAGFMLARKLIQWNKELTAYTIWTGAFSILFAVASCHYDRLTYAGGIKNYYEGKAYDITEYFKSEVGQVSLEHFDSQLKELLLPASQLFIVWAVKFVLTMAPVQYAQIYWPREEGLLTKARKSAIISHCMWTLLSQGFLLGTGMTVLTVSKLTPEDWGWDRVLAVIIGHAVVSVVLMIPVCLMSTKYTVTKRIDIMRKTKNMPKSVRRRRLPRSEGGPTISLENGLVNDESNDDNSELGVQEPEEPVVIMNGNGHYLNSTTKQE